MRLDVESLRALREVLSRGTFSGAADALGVTPSAVSLKIKRLEERVGLTLVERGPMIEATPDGNDLMAYATTIITAHDAAVAHLQRSDVSGVARLGCNEDVNGGQLTTVLASFKRMHPQIDLEVRVHLSGIVAEWLEVGDVDIAVLEVLVQDVLPGDIELTVEPLKWAQAANAAFDPKDEVPLVVLGPGLNYLSHLEEVLSNAGYQWRKIIECPTVAGVQSAVEQGLGISALNARNVSDGMVEWPGSDSAPLGKLSEVIRCGDGPTSPAILTLRDALVKALEKPA